MNRFFGSNGFSVSDRSDIPKTTFANIRGVCDDDLFRRVTTLASQIDIAPTVLGLLGFPYAPFFGQNILALSGDAPRSLLFNHNHDVTLYQEGKVAILGLQQSGRRTGTAGPLPAAPDADLVGLATAYYQIAFELFRTHRYQ